MAEVAVEVGLNGTALLTDPLLNKGMAFSEAQRTTFSLHGLLPPHVATLDEQVERQRICCLTSTRSAQSRSRLPAPCAAREEGVCPPFDDAALPGLIAAKMWEPVYRPYRRKQGSGR